MNKHVRIRIRRRRERGVRIDVGSAVQRRAAPSSLEVGETGMMLKDTMLYLAKQDGSRTFVSHNRAARRVARRFVAGEVLDEAMDVARALNREHISVSLDHLGENVSDAA